MGHQKLSSAFFALMLLLARATPLQGQVAGSAASPLPPWAAVQHTPAWHALLLGVSTYDHAWPLPTATYDAGLMRKALKPTSFGDTVPIGTGYLKRQQMLDAIDAFVAQLNEGDVALVYFSGHGISSGMVDYLVPSDAGPPDPDRMGHIYISVDYLLGEIAKKAAVAILLMDSCRADPYQTDAAASVFLDPAIAPPAAPLTGTAQGQGTGISSIGASGASIATQEFIAYAARPGQPAFSGFANDPPSSGSIFTRHVSEKIGDPAHEIDRLIGAALSEVRTATGSRQDPFEGSTGQGYVFLTPNQRADQDADETWRLAVDAFTQSGQSQQIRDFVFYYPTSSYTYTARYVLKNGSPPIARADLASAPSVLLSGTIQTTGIDEKGRQVATVTTTAKVRRSWNTLLPTTALMTLNRGDVVRVLSQATDKAVAKILTASGKIGYIGNVAWLRPPDIGASIPLQYASGDIDAGLVQNLLLSGAAAMQNLTSASIRVRVGGASADATAAAARIAFTRALRLRELLVQKGARPEHLTLSYPDSGLANDTAQIDFFMDRR